MLKLAKAFAARGHPVDLLAAQPEGSLRSQLGDSVRLVSLDRWWGLVPGVRRNKRRRVLASVPALVRYLRRERPAFLMATSHSVNVAAAIGSGIARTPARLVLRIDSQLTRAPELAGTRTQRRRMRRARRFFPRADVIVAISQGVAADVVRELGYPESRVATIHNPVVTPELEAAVREPLDHPWFTPDSPPVVLGVGRLVAQKDFATLIRAFARLRARCRARLLLLGEGRDRARLESLVSELGLYGEVSLPGAVANPLPYMYRAAAFAMSSAWEGFGNVLVEAMLCGCPVVSTDCPSGPAEILEGGALGPLVPVGDDAALADALAQVLEKRVAADRLRARAQQFSVDRAADRYLDALLG
jgi:glycosyltransferase involved in cell wall biosynthesis